MSQRRVPRALLALLLLAASAGVVRAAADADGERADVMQWRALRQAALTSDSGWLTLAGLLWLSEGRNSFGRASDNALVLDHPALAARAGTFEVSGAHVRFVSAPGAKVTHDGAEVSELELR